MANEKMDVYGFDIQAMIAAENDPDKRIQLIVLNNMNNTLLETIQVVRNLVEEQKTQREAFEAHARNGDALMNQGRGMWRVIAAVALAAQGMVGWAWYEVRDTLKTMQATDVRVESRIDALERRK